MSDNIPFELQEIIMKNLPVEPLIRFQSVCKAWKSLIDSSYFIRNHITQQKQQHLLVRYHGLLIRYKIYVSVADIDGDDTYTDTDTDTDIDTDTIPQSVVNLVEHYTNSSHGLLCSFGETDRKTVIWNPSIRKAVDVVLPDMADDEMYTIVLGFGVCRETTDPKIIKIRISSDVEGLIPWQVEVFTLSARVWRSTYSSNVPSKFAIFDEEQVVVGGVVYWLANDRVGAEDGHDNLIVSFDLTSEEFGEVKLPDRLANTRCSLCMFKPRESPVVIEGGIEDYKRGYHVWVMKDGVPKLFEKLFTISGHTPDGSLVSSVLGFRKTGEALVELQPYGSVGTLAAYEPYSKAFSNLGVSGRYISVYSYTKTLLLL